MRSIICIFVLAMAALAQKPAGGTGGGSTTPTGIPYQAPFTSVTTVTVLAATHEKGTTAIAGDCYDNSSPRKKLTLDADFPTKSSAGDFVFTWTGAGSKTGYCEVFAAGSVGQAGPAGADGAPGDDGDPGPPLDVDTITEKLVPELGDYIMGRGTAELANRKFLVQNMPFEKILNFASPLTRSGTDIGIGIANTSQSGAISSTDWNTFNTKVAGPASVGSNGIVAVYSGTTGKIIASSNMYASGNNFGFLASTGSGFFHQLTNQRIFLNGGPSTADGASISPHGKTHGSLPGSILFDTYCDPNSASWLFRKAISSGPTYTTQLSIDCATGAISGKASTWHTGVFNSQTAGDGLIAVTNGSTISTDPFMGVRNNSNVWQGGLLGNGKLQDPTVASIVPAFYSLTGVLTPGTRSGNTTEVCTVAGTKTAGKQITFDAQGNCTASAFDAGEAAGGDIEVQVDGVTTASGPIINLASLNQEIVYSVSQGSGKIDITTAAGPMMAKYPAIQNGEHNHCVPSGGSTTAYTCSFSPVSSGSYQAGMVLMFKPDVTNTTTGPTVDVDSRGPLTIVQNDGSAVSIGSIVAGRPYQLYYNGTHLRLPPTGSSASGDVVGPGSSTSGNIASFGNGTGKLIQDTGIAAANVAQGAASSTSGNFPSFSGTSGKQLQDSGVAAASVAIGAGSAVNGNLVSFSGTGGKQLQDSGIAAGSVALDTAVTTDGGAPWFPFGYPQRAVAGTAGQLANGLVRVWPIVVQTRQRIEAWGWIVSAAASGNIAGAIYSKSGSKVPGTDVNAAAATGGTRAAIASPVELPRGEYYIALTGEGANSMTMTIHDSNTGFQLINLGSGSGAMISGTAANAATGSGATLQTPPTLGTITAVNSSQAYPVAIAFHQ